MLRHMLWIYFFQYQKGTDKNLPLYVLSPMQTYTNFIFKKTKNNKCRTPISR